MKTHLIAITTLVLVLALPVTLYAQETDPAAVVTASYEAFNAGDIDAFVAFYADDAVEAIEPSPPFGTYVGHEEIRAWAEGLMALNAGMEVVEILEVEGDTISVKSRYWDDDIRALGIAYLEAIEVTTLQGGKIVADTYTVTEESMAEFQAAMAALPQTGGPSPIATLPSWLGVGGLLLLALGVGLGLRRRVSTGVR